MLQLPVYLDYNATTPCDPRVVQAMLPYFSERFGNAASNSHTFGWQANEAVEIAREQVAALIGAEKSEIIFTAGATEACNLALKGVVETYGSGEEFSIDTTAHIITCNIEHKAVLDSCRHLEKKGIDITYLNVTHDGLIDLEELENSFKKNTILVAIMYANNEIGTIMPIREISRIAKQRGVFVFCDATQAVGKIPVDVNQDGIDLMAFSSHKIYGPKGAGALYVRRKNPRIKLTPQIDGGGHEKGIRNGTLNVPAIVGFGKACEICMNEMKEDAIRIRSLRDKLENALLSMEDVHLNGSPNHRLPQVTNLSFKYADGDALITSFNKNVAISSGSACASASMEPSHVLKAIGLSDEMANSSIRFSLGRPTTTEEIDYTIEQVKKAVNQLREINPYLSISKK